MPTRFKPSTIDNHVDRINSIINAMNDREAARRADYAAKLEACLERQAQQRRIQEAQQADAWLAQALDAGDVEHIVLGEAPTKAEELELLMHLNGHTEEAPNQPPANALDLIDEPGIHALLVLKDVTGRRVVRCIGTEHADGLLALLKAMR